MRDFMVLSIFRDDEDKAVALLVIEKAERWGMHILDPIIIIIIMRALRHTS